MPSLWLRSDSVDLSRKQLRGIARHCDAPEEGHTDESINPILTLIYLYVISERWHSGGLIGLDRRGGHVARFSIASNCAHRTDPPGTVFGPGGVTVLNSTALSTALGRAAPEPRPEMSPT